MTTNFYFNSSGMLTFTSGNSSAMGTIQDSLYGGYSTSSSSNSSSSSLSNSSKLAALEAAGLYNSETGETSSFSDTMKEQARAASGKLNNDQKEAIRDSNGNYLKIAAAQARLQEIMSRKPKTYDYTDDDWVEDMVMNYLGNSTLTSFVPYRPDNYYN